MQRETVRPAPSSYPKVCESTVAASQTKERSTLLREHLDGLGNCDSESVTNRLKLINAQTPHSVQLIDTPEISPLDNQNCVMYALGLRLNPAYEPDGRYYARTAYVKGLIDDGYLIYSGPTPGNGLVAVYANVIRITHLGVAGKYGRIVSKWGCGYVFSHRPLEVPLGYGQIVRYFHPIEKKVAYRELRRW